MQDLTHIKTGSLCPALASAGLLGDKWTLLILRELFMGTARFNDFQRALPRISPTVLSKRLKMREANDLIINKSNSRTPGKEYLLTRSGRELGPILEYMAVWGLRWRRRRIGEEDYDVSGFMWDFHRTLKTDALPDGETVFQVTFIDQDRDIQQNGYAKWWLIAKENTVDLCIDDPGRDVDLYVTSSLDCLIAVWMGDTSVRESIETGAIILEGLPHLMRNAAGWFPESPLSTVRPSDVNHAER